MATLTREEFDLVVKDFVAKSEWLLDGWRIRSDGENVLYVESKTWRKELVLEHHIVYSPSYQVPVMYFRVSDAAGQVVNDVVDALNLESGIRFTPMPHPVHQTPFLQVHPCETSKWMDEMCRSSSSASTPAFSNYLVSWLSLVGPQVGIKLSNDYAGPFR